MKYEDIELIKIRNLNYKYTLFERELTNNYRYKTKEIRKLIIDFLRQRYYYIENNIKTKELYKKYFFHFDISFLEEINRIKNISKHINAFVNLMKSNIHYKLFVNVIRKYYINISERYDLADIFYVNLFYNNIDSNYTIPLCEFCGSECTLDYGIRFNHTCGSDYCKYEQYKKTNLSRYGEINASMTKDIKEKIKRTNMERYGVFNVFEHEYFQNKSIETRIKRYGKPYYMQSEIGLIKLEKTCIEKYGKKSYFSTEEYKDKLSEIYFNKRINNYLDIIKHYNLPIKYDNRKFYCKVCNNEINIETKRKGNNNYDLIRQRFRFYKDCICTHCYNPNNKKHSSYEFFIENYLRNIYKLNIIKGYRNWDKNNRKIELDLYIPSYNIAIEFNGTFWHSDKYLNEKYHYDKYTIAKNNNINVLFIWEDAWLYRKQVLLKKLNSIFVLKIDLCYINECEYFYVNNVSNNDYITNNRLTLYDSEDEAIGILYNDMYILVYIINNNTVKEIINHETVFVVNGFRCLYNKYKYLIHGFELDLDTILYNIEIFDEYNIEKNKIVVYNYNRYNKNKKYKYVNNIYTSGLLVSKTIKNED